MTRHTLAAEAPEAAEAPALATSETEIRRRTGRGWEEWFDLLDDWGAAERPHREIARQDHRGTPQVSGPSTPAGSRTPV